MKKWEMDCVMQVIRSSRVEETWCLDPCSSADSPAAADLNARYLMVGTTRTARLVLLYAASGIPPSYMVEESFYLGQECGAAGHFQNFVLVLHCG